MLSSMIYLSTNNNVYKRSSTLLHVLCINYQLITGVIATADVMSHLLVAIGIYIT